MIQRPERGEIADYYFTYIDQVPGGDIRAILHEQLANTATLLEGIGEERSLSRYTPDKWSIREVAAHICDCERLFTFRAFWFARGLGAPLPSFDQNVANAHASADARPLASHIDEFRAIRTATLALFDALPSEAWPRTGVASDNPMSVRGLAYVTAGHVAHHVRILRERYL
jgi:DinB superfamily